MTIRKLDQSINEQQVFNLHLGCALLFFKSQNDNICLYFEQPSREDFDKILKFSSFDELKFIGDELIAKQLFQQLPSLPPPVKNIYLKNKLKVIYCPLSGRIRVEKRTKNVLIVDDSVTIQKILSKIVKQSDILNLIGVADRPSKAIEIIESNRVDLITLDIHMPEMNGVDFLKSYISKHKIPTVMISSVSMNEGPLVLEALSSGASTYIQKPSIDQLQVVSSEIIEKLETLAFGRVKDSSFHSCKVNSNFFDYNGLIAIGSSTGGTQALQEILTTLPDQIPPIVIVQHIPAVFSKALAERLNGLCRFTVKEAEDGEFIKRNTVYIAPGGRQFKLVKRGQEKRVIINDDPPVNRFQPSVDYLFESVAMLQEEVLLGIILTGMGKDGAKGLLAMKQAGAMTMAQDEESSIVFGMPKEAINIGAAKKIIPLNKMSESIVEELNKLTIKNVA
jgi:two-component system, chemotaxis family, protein-glutamate methylesterase/glutaminase